MSLSREDMLGRIVSILPEFPNDVIGIVYDLCCKLRDLSWRTATKRHLRKEDAWSNLPLGRDLTKERPNCVLVRNSRRRILSAQDLEVVVFHEEDETSVSGLDMILRAMQHGCDWMQEDALELVGMEVPEEFSGRRIPFVRTVYRDDHGEVIPFLYAPNLTTFEKEKGGKPRWCIDFVHVDDDFLRDWVFVRPRWDLVSSL